MQRPPQVYLHTEPAAPGEPATCAAHASTAAAVLVDGVEAVPAPGCPHGLSWHVQLLADGLYERAVARPEELAALLAEAIGAVAAEHARSCGLAWKVAPASAVLALRPGPSRWQALLLGTAVLVADDGNNVHRFGDRRVDAVAVKERHRMEVLPIGSREHEAARRAKVAVERLWRNRPGGYWLASTDPAAAAQAVTAELPRVYQYAMLSAGAARWLPLTRQDPPVLLSALGAHGPAGVVEQLRALESEDPEGVVLARETRFADAAVVYARQDP